MNKDLYLVLENGKIFKGKSFGAEKEVIAELVFSTAMTGYLEALTDNSYYGQALIQTFPLIGNYGIIPEDLKCDSPKLSAYIIKEACENPSNFREDGLLSDYLKEKGIPGICGIDTRALTKIIRDNGVMNAKLTDNIESVNLSEIKNYKIENAVKSVAKTEITDDAPSDAKYTIVLYDFGVSDDIKGELIKRGCRVVTVPYNTPADKALSYKPDGIVLSNGPGNPEENTETIEIIKELLNTNIPIFGICLGHQLLALANGFKTEKLLYGHRGANQPVLCTKGGKIFITCQNHGYTVVPSSISKSAVVTFKNTNDNTCEGIEYTDKNAYSVQFMPDTNGGPGDMSFLYDELIKRAEVYGKCR